MLDAAANRDLFDALQAVNRTLGPLFDARVTARGLTLARAGEEIEVPAAGIRADLLSGVERYEKGATIEVVRAMSRNMPAREREGTE